MNLKEAIENFKTYLILEKSLSPNSVEAYLNDINKLAKYSAEFHKVTEPDRVTYEIIKEHLAHISSLGVTDRTQARYISSIKSFFKYLVYDGLLSENPTELLEAPKVVKKQPDILTIEEIELILNAVEMYKPEGQRNKAIIEVLYSCGLRVSELIGIKLSNIDFRQGTIKIEGKGHKERIISLTHNAKIEIKRYLKVYRNYLDVTEECKDTLFLNKRGTALSRVMVFNIIKHLAERAGINKKVSPHTFRHSFAFLLLNKGNDLQFVSQMLGHESILSTSIYIQ